jgi:cell division transport system permease protein
VTATQREQASADLEAMPQVEHVYYENQYEAYDLLRRQNPNSPLIDSITPQQLPESFRVKLKDRTTAPVVISAFSGRPGVASAVLQPRAGASTTGTGLVGVPGSGARS